MSTRQRKKRDPKVFRSMKEFKERYFPNAYEGEALFKVKEDPNSLGTGMAEEFLEKVRRQLQIGK